MNWALGRSKCKGIKQENGKEWCSFGGGWLSHRCSVVTSLTPFVCCGLGHKKRECATANNAQN